MKKWGHQNSVKSLIECLPFFCLYRPYMFNNEIGEMSIFCRKHHKCKLPFIMRMESNSFSNYYLWTSSSSYYFLWKSLPIQTGLWLPICTPQAIILISWQKIYVKSDMANLHQVLTLEIQDGCCWPVTLCWSDFNLIYFRIFAPSMSVQNLCLLEKKHKSSLCSEASLAF